MRNKKSGFPEEGEIVICTVKRILNNSVFLDLDEYSEKEGIMHISEIAPGRIRTIREYVKEGKKVVCVVLRINPKLDHIELSLRRVTKSTKLNKIEELKLEEKSEKLLDTLASEIKVKPEEMYQKIAPPLIEEYGSLNNAFQEVMRKNESVFINAGIEKKLSDKLIKMIKIRFKPQEIKIIKDMIIKCKGPVGIDIVKKALNDGIEFARKNEHKIEIIYFGSGRYRMIVSSLDYKDAEKRCEEAIEIITKELEKEKGDIVLAK